MPEEQEFTVDKSNNPEQRSVVENNGHGGKHVIDEANYQVHATQEGGPSAVGRGGDALFRNIQATKEQLLELMEETQTVQDWVQREASNSAAIACLDNENLKEIYFKIKDGFGNYGRIMLMGYKTPLGVEIPRLKIYDADGEVLEVLTGPMAIDEINKRALAYQNEQNGYEEVPMSGNEAVTDGVIQDYQGTV